MSIPTGHSFFLFRDGLHFSFVCLFLEGPHMARKYDGDGFRYFVVRRAPALPDELAHVGSFTVLVGSRGKLRGRQAASGTPRKMNIRTGSVVEAHDKFWHAATVKGGGIQDKCALPLPRPHLACCENHLAELGRLARADTRLLMMGRILFRTNRLSSRTSSGSLEPELIDGEGKWS